MVKGGGREGVGEAGTHQYDEIGHGVGTDLPFVADKGRSMQILGVSFIKLVSGTDDFHFCPMTY